MLSSARNIISVTRHNRPNKMLRKLLPAMLLLVLQTQAFATWSVIAVDRKTGQIVIASATCVPQAAFAGFPAKGLKDVQAIIIPGIGVAAAQANVDRTRKMQDLIATELKRGTDPARIVELLKSLDSQHPSRQYGITDMRGRSAGYSGATNGKQSLDRQGTIAGTGISFSIQGNILASDEVIEEAVKAFQGAKGTLADRVMAAMEAADARGGDRRCNCQTPPNPPAPCDNKTAHVAYLVMANKNDNAGTGLNDGSYTLDLEVTDQDIKPDENDNPVKTLRMRYDSWRASQKQHKKASSQSRSR